MAEIAFILTGKPKRGGLPPFKRMEEKESEESKPAMAAGKESLGMKLAGKAPREEVGFWDESAPQICETCGHRKGAECGAVDGVNFDECDQTLSGCSKWEAGEAREEEEPGEVEAEAEE